ncbi:hypothetical protein HPB50_010976 [Hyalomma asiaticum]|uniref:Uncharacterized protein n=1 Tax=Hyalomma asiaticum TaxID=266040 RepID=A0ACB7SP82_HYAAI|nr:hypothetical protein HPB50_010976 [Hyalomma asiaticum]
MAEGRGTLRVHGVYRYELDQKAAESPGQFAGTSPPPKAASRENEKEARRVEKGDKHCVKRNRGVNERNCSHKRDIRVRRTSPRKPASSTVHAVLDRLPLQCATRFAPRHSYFQEAHSCRSRIPCQQRTRQQGQFAERARFMLLVSDLLPERSFPTPKQKGQPAVSDVSSGARPPPRPKAAATQRCQQALERACRHATASLAAGKERRVSGPTTMTSMLAEVEARPVTVHRRASGAEIRAPPSGCESTLSTRVEGRKPVAAAANQPVGLGKAGPAQNGIPSTLAPG